MSRPEIPCILDIEQPARTAWAPVSYFPGFLDEPDKAFAELWNELEWVRMGNTPRREYYVNDVPVPYTYGRGAGARTYEPQAWHPRIRAIQHAVAGQIGELLPVCFLNGYEDARDNLGYHADDSPEMDDSLPIAIVTVGSERDIMFMPQGRKDMVSRLRLEHGSLCLMAPGMQDTHFHRIPKCDRICGPRVSLTFRGYVDPATL